MPKYYLPKDRLGGYPTGSSDPACHCIPTWVYLIENLGIKSVLDLGCGEGHAVETFLKLRVDSLGVDGCKKAIKNSVVPKNVVLHDFYDGPYQPDKKFDLTWSCEVVEHIHEEHIGNFIQTIVNAECQWVAMTHALPGQGGHHHVNCQKSDYWIDLFKKYGYVFQKDLTKKVKDYSYNADKKITYFRKSGLIFKKED